MAMEAVRPLLAVFIAALVWGCTSIAPTTLTPPLIEAVGRLASVEQGGNDVAYVFAEGRRVFFSTQERRLLTPIPGGEFAVLGTDAIGPFAAAYMAQGGLPADCFVDNSLGIDRGTFVELRGVLWRKASDFVSFQPMAPNTAYPQGTRFCFDERAEISRTVQP